MSKNSVGAWSEKGRKKRRKEGKERGREGKRENIKLKLIKGNFLKEWIRLPI